MSRFKFCFAAYCKFLWKSKPDGTTNKDGTANKI